MDHSDVCYLPDSFPFPFEPYDIQKLFMKEVYKTLELGKIGIFESPTGTGKSLSLICGAMKWLVDYEEKQRKEVEMLENNKNRDNVTDFSEPDWILAFSKQQELSEKTKKSKEEQELRLKHENRLKELKNGNESLQNLKRKRVSEFKELFKDAPDEILESFAKEDDEDDTIVLQDYVSDDEDQSTDLNSDSEEADGGYITKIYYCSRTHSQLTQFVREVQKSPYGEHTRLVPLGSRQTLCINESVKRLQSLSLINDKCLELQKNKKGSPKTESKRKKKSGCPYYKSSSLDLYKDEVLVEVQDIEQLVVLGKKMKACPYFGTRFAVPPAQLVILPYNLLLHKSTRESCGIKLQDNIVIIDEAHNLLETITNIHSVQITGAQLSRAHSQLSQYMEKYKLRLKAKNLMYIKQILYILQAFIKFLGVKVCVSSETTLGESKETKMLTLNDFLSATLIDNLNLFKIRHYCEKSQISKKLNGFVEKYQPKVCNISDKKEELEVSAVSKFLRALNKKEINKKHEDDTAEAVSLTETSQSFCSPLMFIESFLEALTASNKDGRIMICKEVLLSKSYLKFLLLNPAVYFTDIIKDVRALIIAGGTMQPISEFRNQLFAMAGVQQDRILEFSCGHVISSNNIHPVILSNGPSGLEFDFSFQSRNSHAMIEELGRVLCNLCNIVSGGIVVFFSSYEYEHLVYSHWEKGNILMRIANKKKIFREPKKASEVDQVLNQYTLCVQKSVLPEKTTETNGAIIFSVVGGKMSEGINFSDDLGRCVIVVGLPYPNINSPELKEKMDYLNTTMAKDRDGRSPGQVHYENLCMRAVNQSIGRAIRHHNDYACILLIDSRFSKPSIRSKLPGWISSHLRPVLKFGPTLASIAQFFNGKKGSS